MMKNQVVLLLVTTILFTACAALHNDSEAITETIRQTKKYIYSQKKETTYYNNHRRVFTLEAIYFDWSLRQSFAKAYSQYNFSDESEILAEQKKEYQEQYHFFILASFQELPAKLEKSESTWKFFLKDWDSDNYLSVVQIAKLSKEDLYYQFLEANYQKLDNWTEFYLLKIDRDFTITPDKNLVLRLASLQQSAQLNWEKAEPFFLQ